MVALVAALGCVVALGGLFAWILGGSYLREHAFECGAGALFGRMSEACSGALFMKDYGPAFAALGVMLALAAPLGGLVLWLVQAAQRRTS